MYPVLVRQRDESTVVIALSGDVDCLAGDEIESTILAAIPHWARIMIDLAGVTFCSSTGLGVFIRCEQAAVAQGARVALVNPSPTVKRLIDITGLQHLLGAATTGEDLHTVSG